jgi:hypothetical protein
MHPSGTPFVRAEPRWLRVAQVWIANEESSKVLGVGVDELVAQGHMRHLLPGPLFWVDTADRCAKVLGGHGKQMSRQRESMAS